MYTKRFITYFKIWVQIRVGAIPRLPFELTYKDVENSTCFYAVIRMTLKLESQKNKTRFSKTFISGYI